MVGAISTFPNWPAKDYVVPPAAGKLELFTARGMLRPHRAGVHDLPLLPLNGDGELNVVTDNAVDEDVIPVRVAGIYEFWRNCRTNANPTPR
jgi:hypothetical protein